MQKWVVLKITEIPLFNSIDVLECKRILEPYGIEPILFNKDKILHHKGDPLEGLYLLLEGEARAEIYSSGGKTVTIETLIAPCPLAAAILFQKDPRWPVSLKATKAGSYIKMPKPLVLKLFTECPSLLESYLADAGEKIVFLAEKIRLFQFKSLKQKLCSHLIELSKVQNSTDITLPYTKEVLAQLFGVTRPALSRVFSELSKENFILAKGKSVSIRDLEILKELLYSE